MNQKCLKYAEIITMNILGEFCLLMSDQCSASSESFKV